MYKITLADGTALENLVLNGNNFIAQTAVDDAVFKDKMATVTLTNLEDGGSCSGRSLRSRRPLKQETKRLQNSAVQWPFC